MRFDLAATAALNVSPSSSTIPLSISLRPAGTCPGTFEYQTDSKTLVRMLRQETDLQGFELAAFTGKLRTVSQARLRAIDLKDDALYKIGFFVD